MAGTQMSRAAKYGFIFFVGTAITIGGVCGLVAIAGVIFGTL